MAVPVRHEVALDGVDYNIELAGGLLAGAATSRVFAHPLAAVGLDRLDRLQHVPKCRFASSVQLRPRCRVSVQNHCFVEVSECLYRL